MGLLLKWDVTWSKFGVEPGTRSVPQSCLFIRRHDLKATKGKPYEANSHRGGISGVHARSVVILVCAE